MNQQLSPLFSWRGALVDSTLSPSARHIGLTLSLHMNERDDSCLPSLDELQRETGRGRTTILAALSELESLGWLTVARAKGGGRGRANMYTTTVPALKGPESELLMGLKGPETVPFALACKYSTKPSTKPTLEVSNETSSASGSQKTLTEELWDMLEAEGVKAPSAKSPRADFAKAVREMAAAGWTPDVLAARINGYRRHPTLGRSMLTVFSIRKWGEQIEADMPSTSGRRVATLPAGERERIHEAWRNGHGP